MLTLKTIVVFLQGNDQELLELCSYEEINESRFARLVELVTDPSVNINCKDTNGLTPLLSLLWNNQSESLYQCAEVLLQREEIDVKAKDNFGDEALTILQRMYDGKEKNIIASLIASKFKTSKLTVKSDLVQPTPGELYFFFFLKRDGPLLPFQLRLFKRTAAECQKRPIR